MNEQDMQYQEDTIKRVDGDREQGWELHFTKGLCFCCPKDSSIVPEPGMMARLYGKGFGFAVRGLLIDGVTVFYRTEAEQAAKHKKWCDDRAQKRRDEFESDRINRDARYDALPEHFRRRINKFRANNVDFRWEYEPYEMFCCEEAVKIAEALKTAEAVKQFHDKKYEEQKALIPALSDGHSGNTFGCAVHLAYEFLSEPENVVKMHGALAPLVGSEEYGCVPKRCQMMNENFRRIYGGTEAPR